MKLLPFSLCAAGLSLGLALGVAWAEDTGHHAEAEAKVELPKIKLDKKPEKKADKKVAEKAVEKVSEKATEASAPAASEGATAANAPKEPVSMGELRDMIESKINEVRANRSAAPVVRVQTKGGGRSVGKTAAKVDKSEHRGHWDYQGANGPEHWNELSPEFKQCGVGERQSPIDIRDGIPVELDPIQFDYKLSAFRVIDNGHTVQVNVEPGNRIVVNGRRYELVEFHFHRPSEERLNGRQFEMVAHLVHKDLEGKLAIVAVLIEEGKDHPIVQQVWNNLPLEKHTEQAGLQGLDLLQLLPEDRRYATYMGSLSTPPCTEGVLWMVLKKPVTMSSRQLAIFSRLYPMNARPVQPLGGRLIKDGQ